MYAQSHMHTHHLAGFKTCDESFEVLLLLGVCAVAQHNSCVRLLCSKGIRQRDGILVLVELPSGVTGHTVYTVQERLRRMYVFKGYR